MFWSLPLENEVGGYFNSKQIRLTENVGGVTNIMLNETQNWIPEKNEEFSFLII